MTMIHMTPEDLKSSGLAKAGDSFAQAFFRPFGAIAKTVASSLQAGPAEGIKTAVQESKRIHEQRDEYKRSDFHLDNCSSSFCRGCK
jgi:hypothetical protein